MGTYFNIMVTVEMPYTKPDGTTAFGTYALAEDGPAFDSAAEANLFCERLRKALLEGSFAAHAIPFEADLNTWQPKPYDADDE